MAKRPPIPRPIGYWTAQKLEHLSAYLKAFAIATKSARERYYIDTMAGCGECRLKTTGAPTLGSAWRALNVSPPFTGIHLVELDDSSAEYLRNRIRDHPSVRVYKGDCNVVVPEQILPNLSTIAPTLAFVDPTGVQVNWSLLIALAEHRRGTRGREVELLILFPFDMVINRWLSQPTLWSRLDEFYGTPSWRDALSLEEGLDSTDSKRTRFLDFYVARLKDGLGYRYVKPFGPLTYGRRKLYHMIFATDDPAGDRIMSDVWKKDRPLPGQLFYDYDFPIKPASWPARS
jgi:three-Cys-motif partner protein